MIQFSPTKILLVPDPENPRGLEMACELARAIEQEEHWLVKVAAMPAGPTNTDTEASPDEKDFKQKDEEESLICYAEFLEGLSGNISLVWIKGDPFYSKRREDIESVMDIQDSISSAMNSDSAKPRLKIKKSIIKRLIEDYESGNPDAIILFGKAAMLTGQLSKTDLLFINPVYDNEYPWKQLHDQELESAIEYSQSRTTHLFPEMTRLTTDGIERCSIPPQAYRHHRPYAVCSQANLLSEFMRRYPLMGVVDETISDLSVLAETVKEFASRRHGLPHIELEGQFRQLHLTHDFGEILSFDRPVIIGHRPIKGLAMERSTDSLKGEIALVVEGSDTRLPLDTVYKKQDLDALNAALQLKIENDIKSLPPRKRILLVPDFHSPTLSPMVKELHRLLTQAGHHVVVYDNDGALLPVNNGLERRCKRAPFDLAVSLDSGCAMIGHMLHIPRLFINPDWESWRSHPDRDSKRLRDMVARSYIRKDRVPARSWFTADAADPERIAAHTIRFGEPRLLSDIALETPGASGRLAALIHDALFTDKE